MTQVIACSVDELPDKLKESARGPAERGEVFVLSYLHDTPFGMKDMAYLVNGSPEKALELEAHQLSYRS